MSKHSITTTTPHLFALILLLALCTGFSTLNAAEKTEGLAAGLVNPGYAEKPAWFKDSFLDIREDIAEAEEANKRVVLYFYQDGCPYCGKLLKDNFGNPDIAAMTQTHFDVIALNMWGDREITNLAGEDTTEKAFAAALKVQYTPTLIFFDEAGNVALRVNGYYTPDEFTLALDFVAGKYEKQGSIRDYLLKRIAAEKKAAEQPTLNPLVGGLEKPLQLAQAQQENKRPLLVMFEQPTCTACDELHNDVLKRKEVAYSLSNLDVAQVNIESEDTLQTPTGETLSMQAWAQQLGIKYTPSLVFFDAAGQEVFRTEAYLKSFHLHGAMDYVASQAYQHQPSFQRFLQHRMDVMQAHGFEIDLMQ